MAIAPLRATCIVETEQAIDVAPSRVWHDGQVSLARHGLTE